MRESIPITNLNDFLFCPYSIYLHGIYSGAEEGLFKATPQLAGTTAHAQIEKCDKNNPDILWNLPVRSEKFGIHGIIDQYNLRTKTLIEHKNKISKVFPGMKLQIWSQYLCLSEMGYIVETLLLKDIQSNTIFPVNLPTEENVAFLCNIIEKFRMYNPEKEIEINENKCRRCIYCGLCEKSEMNNDY